MTIFTPGAYTTDMTAPVLHSPAVDIAVTDLVKTYEFRPVLRKVSVEIAAGERVVVLGPNGAGKTTLLRILATVAKPSRGSVIVGGCELPAEAVHARHMIGFVGHGGNVYEDLTARENLEFFARLHGLQQVRQHVDKVLAWSGLGHRADERVRTFSRGQLQRIALARGTIHDPRILLLDEPDTGLDEDATDILQGLIAERHRRGETTVFTTHWIDRGLAWSDRVIVLAAGRVIADAQARETSYDGVRKLIGAEGRRSRG